MPGTYAKKRVLPGVLTEKKKIGTPVPNKKVVWTGVQESNGSPKLIQFIFKIHPIVVERFRLKTQPHGGARGKVR